MPRTLERLRTDAVRFSEELREEAARLLSLRRDAPNAELHVRLQCEYAGTTVERLAALERRIPAGKTLAMHLNRLKREVKTRSYPSVIEPDQFSRVFPGEDLGLMAQTQAVQTTLPELWALATWQIAREEPARWSGCTISDMDEHQRQIGALEQSCTAKRDELQAIRAEVQSTLDGIRNVFADVERAMAGVA